jgi:hypothetical protein
MDMGMLLAIGFGLALLLGKSSSPASTASVLPGKTQTPSILNGGPYYTSFMNSINGYTQAYSDGAISLAQWQNYMVNLKGEIAQARANNQVTDSDVQLLYAATGI